MSLSRKRVVFLTTALVALAVTAAAIAYWTAGGSGTGTASTGTNVNLKVNQTSTVANMFPGDAPQALTGTFDNGNPGPTYVGTITASIGTISKAQGAVGDCVASDYTLANPVIAYNKEVPAGNNVGSWSGPTIQFNNKTTVNQDGCKGATVNLAYTISNP